MIRMRMAANRKVRRDVVKMAGTTLSVVGVSV
jgi:hypothetical protein